MLDGAEETQSIENGRFVAVPGHFLASVADELIVLNQQSGVYVGLNAVARRVLDLLEVPMSLAELVSRVTDEYEVTREVAEKDVAVLLSDFVRQGLVKRAGVLT